MNKEMLHKIFTEMEKEHLNLFHSYSKSRLKKDLTLLENKLPNLTQYELQWELLKISAKFKDAHTKFLFKEKPLPLIIKKINNNYFLVNADKSFEKFLYKKLISVNNVKVKDIKKLSNMVTSFETKEWFEFCFCKDLKDVMFLIRSKIINADDKLISYQFENCTEKLVIDVNAESTFNIVNDWELNTLYETKIINGVKYIRYSSCSEDKNYSLKDFTGDVDKMLKDNDVIIFDLTNNSGGNSELIKPVIEIIKQKNVTGYALINNGVFSSGRIVLRDLCKLGFIMAGTGTGGAAKSYGYAKKVSVDGYGANVSIRLWDFSKVFKTSGSIKPTIKIARTLKDYEQKNDPALNYCISQILNNKRT